MISLLEFESNMASNHEIAAVELSSGGTVSVVIPSEVEGPRDRTIGKAAGFLHFANAPVGMTIKQYHYQIAIHFVRGERAMLDSDLAAIYGVPLNRLNEPRRRNARRFPRDFAFQLQRKELANLKSQIATSSLHGGRRKLPWAFTEHGAIMLASVLNSEVAVKVSTPLAAHLVHRRRAKRVILSEVKRSRRIPRRNREAMLRDAPMLDATD